MGAILPVRHTARPVILRLRPPTLLRRAPDRSLPRDPAAHGNAMATPVLAVRSLSKRFALYERPVDRLKQTLWRGRRQFYREFWALRDVGFTLAPGQALGVIGRNGSGKSRLLK